MKNSNNIIWRMSTAATLLLRALQTDGATLHTHYAGPSQALSVMMMMAPGLLLKTLQTAEKEGEESGPVLNVCHTLVYAEVTGHLCNLRSL